MKKILTTILIALTFSAFSQIKLGHINSSDLMRLMPELEEAQQKLQAYGRELQAESQTMRTALENMYNEFQANQNQWSELIQKTKMRAIQDLDARIQDYMQNAENDYKEQEAKFLNPIIEKAREAIAEVAKENKYTYIFDISVGALLYYSDSEDILDLVKKKMNLK
jgi:outer membrane protein